MNATIPIQIIPIVISEGDIIPKKLWGILSYMLKYYW